MQKTDNEVGVLIGLAVHLTRANVIVTPLQPQGLLYVAMHTELRKLYVYVTSGGIYIIAITRLYSYVYMVVILVQ